MATLRADSLSLSVSSFLISTVFCSVGETKIRAEPGQNITLLCRAAENKPVIVLEWSRPDSGEHEHVASYLDDQLDEENQHPNYRDRVALQDREMKDGDVSLVSKNVMINDTGTYECRVDYSKHKRMKRANLWSDPICIINSEVAFPPGNPGKQKEEKPKQKENNTGSTVGLSVGVPIPVLALVGVGSLLRKRSRRPPEKQNSSLQPMNAENHLEAKNERYDFHFHREQSFNTVTEHKVSS